ncbi:MAG: C39 family peptidase [Desulfovibrio sp.]
MLRKLLLFVVVLISLPSVVCADDYIVVVPDGFVQREQVPLGVPYIKQRDKYSCATNSLGMVMAYYDNDTALKKYSSPSVWEQSECRINTIRKKGNNMNGLKKAALANGFENTAYMKADLNKVEYLVANGVPVVANVRARGSKGEYSHAVVIDGYDADRVHVVDPVKGGFWEAKESFEKRWWAHLSRPKGKKRNTIFVVMPRDKNLLIED